jgi:hypothetical protein
MAVETSVAELRGNHRDPDTELSMFIAKRERERLRNGAEIDYEQQWRKLAEDARNDRRETVAVLWTRYHLRQAARLRNTLSQLVRYHEEEAKKWEGA